MDKLARFYAERAEGEVGLMVTGGIAPNREGVVAWEDLECRRRPMCGNTRSFLVPYTKPEARLPCKSFTQVATRTLRFVWHLAH